LKNASQQAGYLSERRAANNGEERKVWQEADQADKGEFIERTTSVY